MKSVVFDLKRATDVWERERGFTPEERANMEMEKQHHERARRLLRVFALVLVILATYPASITASQVFGIPYSYVRGMRVAPVFWLIWVVLMIVVELALVPNVVKLMKIRYARDVLDHGYQAQERHLGFRYFIYTEDEGRKLRREAMIAIGIALGIVLLEFVSNLYYMFNFSDVDRLTGFVLALVTLFGLMGLTVPLANNQYALDWVYIAIGRRKVKYSTPVPPKKNPVKDTRTSSNPGVTQHVAGNSPRTTPAPSTLTPLVSSAASIPNGRGTRSSQDAPTLIREGNALMASHQYEEAIQAYKEAIRLKPNNSGAHFNLGGAYWHLQRVPEAISCWENTTRLDPSNIVAQQWLAKARDARP